MTHILHPPSGFQLGVMLDGAARISLMQQIPCLLRLEEHSLSNNWQVSLSESPKLFQNYIPYVHKKCKNSKFLWSLQFLWVRVWKYQPHIQLVIFSLLSYSYNWFSVCKLYIISYPFWQFSKSCIRIMNPSILLFCHWLFHVGIAVQQMQ